MTRRTTRAIPSLAVGLLVGCGTAAGSSADLEQALDLELPGYVSAAARPSPETLCDADPSGTGATPPPLSVDLGQPAAVFFQTAPATVEAYAWRVSAEEAQQYVDDATAATAACTFELPTEVHTDGDGIPDGTGTDAQSVQPWSGSGWEGVRIHRVVTGQEQTDRRLVRSGDVVLLVVLRADRDDAAILEPVDDYLAAVAENLE